MILVNIRLECVLAHLLSVNAIYEDGLHKITVRMHDSCISVSYL